MTTEVSFSGNTEIDGILYGTKWSLPSLTFSFAPAEGTTATLLNSVQQSAVRQVLSSVAAATPPVTSTTLNRPLVGSKASRVMPFPFAAPYCGIGRVRLPVNA